MTVKVFNSKFNGAKLGSWYTFEYSGEPPCETFSFNSYDETTYAYSGGWPPVVSKPKVEYVPGVNCVF